MTDDTRRKIFVLDTNVLMHDPACIFRFHEHDIVLPIAVLEELDHAKKGVSEVARNVRQASRFINDLIETAGGDISQGLKLPTHAKGFETGRLYFHMEAVHAPMPNGLSRPTPDNTLLGVTLDLGRRHPEAHVILVSKDINLRIKAFALGVRAEPYTNDQVLEDAASARSRPLCAASRTTRPSSKLRATSAMNGMPCGASWPAIASRISLSTC